MIPQFFATTHDKSSVEIQEKCQGWHLPSKQQGEYDFLCLAQYVLECGDSSGTYDSD
jgi:hypothetical protein